MNPPKRHTHTPALFKHRRKLAAVLFFCLALTLAAYSYLSSPRPVQAQASASADMVISEIYGGGGNSLATYQDDFIELYNRGTNAQNLSGWSLQYASAASGTWDKVALSGTVGPGQYYLVQLTTTGTIGANLPNPDLTTTALGSSTDGIAAGNGKVALVTNNTTLTGTCPQTDGTQTTNIRDFVGYGTANCFETAAAAGPSNNTTSVTRTPSSNDTNNNSTDFTRVAPTPRPAASSFDAAAQGCNFDVTGIARTVSWSHTIANGTSRVLIVGVSTYDNVVPISVPPRVLAVRYNGTALTRLDDLLARAPDNSNAVEMFILKEPLPAAGTYTVEVDVNAGANYVVGGSVSFQDVNQVTPTRVFTRNSGTSTTPSVTVASNPNEIVVDTVSTRFEGGILTVDGSQTQQWNGVSCFGGLNSVGAGSTEGGAATTTMSWTQESSQPWAMGAVSIVPLAPTEVELASFSATHTDGGVQLDWETGYEVDNLGFNVYREDGRGRVRLNPTLIAGSALVAGVGTPLTAGLSYSWTDTAARADSVYWLEDVDLSGARNLHGPVAVAGGRTSQKQQQAKQLGQFSTANGSAGPQVTEQPAALSASDGTTQAAATTAPAPLTSYQLASRAGVKISVDRTGWYRVTQPELTAAGLPATSDPAMLQLYADGVQQAVKLVKPSGAWDASAYLEFYGTGLSTPATDKRTYWLVNGTSAGKRVGALTSPAASSTLARSFQHTLEIRERLLYVSALLNGDGENFFGRVVSSSPVVQTFNVHHSDRTSSTPLPTLEVVLQGFSLQPHKVKVSVNGRLVGTVNYFGQENTSARLTFPRWVLKEGENQVQLVAQNGETDASLVDTLRLTYTHFYRADNDRLFFTAGGAQTIRADGFTGPNVRVLDVTDPNQPREIVPQIALKNGLYSTTFTAADGGTRAYLAFTDNLFDLPAEVKTNQPSKWSTPNNRADLVVITHNDFRAAVEPLVSLRRSQGRFVLVVDVEDIYDEFSYGAHSPYAVRAFLELAKTKWLRKPRFVLLVGDGSNDPRNYQGRGQLDFVPTKMVDTKQMETAMDDWFADFDNDAVPELAVGRLPVRTASEAELMVSKITAYDGAGRGVLLVADRRGADGYDFAADSALLKAYVPGTISVQSIDRGAESVEVTRAQIIDAVNQGQLIANWVGHGSFERWTGDGVLRAADAPALANNGKPTFFVTMTCMNGYYHSNTGESLAEALMRVENGGAVAVWASSGITLPTGQAPLNQKLYEYLFASQPLTLGEAVRSAKAATSDMDARRTWILFGDPTMRIR